MINEIKLALSPSLTITWSLMEKPGHGPEISRALVTGMPSLPFHKLTCLRGVPETEGQERVGLGILPDAVLPGQPILSHCV